MKRYEKYIWAASIIAMCLCIFGLSADTATVSSGKSIQIAAIFERLIHIITLGSIEYHRESFMLFSSHVIRKCAHMAEFGILGALFFLQIRSITAKIQPIYALGFTAFYAATDEIHQAFVPGRGPSLGDVLIDASGAIVGIIAIILIIKNISGDEKYEI